MKQIIIGREGTQPFVITDSYGYVSRQHALFTYDEKTGAMTLTDKSSQNGTFVKMGNQFQQISQCRVDANTIVRLGPYYTFCVKQLLKKNPPPPPPHEKVDIAPLRRVAENYETTKVALDQKQANINTLRSMSLACSLAASLITPLVTQFLGEGKDVQWYILAIGPVVAILFLVVLLSYCSRVSKEIIVKKQRNEKKYKLSYCCPKCHHSYAGKLYENILAEGKCSKCKTELYDSKM
ncbi:MAG: FHA domain-containing protein [Muribaculaceae bacterium]